MECVVSGVYNSEANTMQRLLKYSFLGFIALEPVAMATEHIQHQEEHYHTHPETQWLSRLAPRANPKSKKDSKNSHSQQEQGSQQHTDSF